MANSFYIWDQSIHDLPDQQKRIASARKAATSPEHIDKDAGSGVFPGSGKDPYQTTFNSCTCVDFSKRHLPCKHMYRLAIECGQFGGSFSIGENKNVTEKRQVSLSEAIFEIEKLSDDQQKVISKMLYEILYHGAAFVEVVQNSESEQLLSCPLIQQNGTVDTLTVLLQMRKRDIVILLEKHGCKFDTKLKKADLAPWCLENAPEIQNDLPVINLLSFVEAFNKAQRKVYSYLLRKFDWDYGWEDGIGEYRYPHGSECGESELYWFPNDEITALLTKYGCNRCLDGYSAKAFKR